MTDVDTASTPISPANTQTADNGEGTQVTTPTDNGTQAEPGNVEPDYKRLYEDSERRRAGLDRKLSRLSRERTDTNEDRLWTGDKEKDSVAYQHPLTQRALGELANYQLKEGVSEILKDFQHVPDEVRKAIQNNPKGFASAKARTVDDALEEIETFLYDTYGGAEKKESSPKEIPAVNSNASTAEPGGGEKPMEQWSAEELDKALDEGRITLEESEALIRKLGSSKGVKKVK